jgi:cell division protein FtsW
MAVSAAGSTGFTAAVFKRLALTGLGLGAFVVGATVHYQRWRRHQMALLALALVCLIAVFVPGIGMAKNGAHRWVNPGLPVGFQPSEFAKIILCIWVAAYCDRHLARLRSFVRGFMVPLGVVGLACGLILLEPDFGTAVLTGLVCTAVLVVMGTRVIFLVLAAAASLPLMHQLVFGVPYRMRRVVAFLDPWADPRGSGYQLIQALIAVGSGGTAGLGLGASRQKEAFLPGATNDFTFSIIAEELGFIGSVALIALFAFALWECLKVIHRARDPFGFALGVGLSVLLGVQAAAHIAVVTGCIPTKGLSLPFFSAGGSSLVGSLLAAGILVNIARSEEDPEGHPLKSWQEDMPAYHRLASRAVRRVLAAIAATAKGTAEDGDDG